MAVCNYEKYKLATQVIAMIVMKLKNIQFYPIYINARLYHEPSDPKLHPN
jgi:hypothetical protein